MMKKFFISLMIIGMFFVNTVYADMGPKPTVSIEIIGVNEPFYATLLGKGEGNGPWGIREPYEGKDADETAAIKAFMDSEENDYHFWGFIFKSDGTNKRLSWSYYAPDDFILAVYVPSSGKVFKSEPLKREAFEQAYTCEFDGEHMVVRENNNWLHRFAMIAVRVLLTIFIETAIGLLFGFRSKEQIMLMFKTNLFTQLILNLIFTLCDIYQGYLFAVIIYVPLEILIFIIEGFIYRKRLDENRLKTWFYALLANGVTAYLGLYASAFFR